MDTQINTNHFDSSNFLNQGAFVRWQGMWFLFELCQGPDSSENSSLNSISYARFFDRKLSRVRVQKVTVWDPQTWIDTWKSESPSIFSEWQGPNREVYTRSFQEVQQKIQQGLWEKAVPIAFDRIPRGLRKSELVSLLGSLAEAPEPLIPFGMWTQEAGVLGATPETLFYRRGPRVKSMALAGTQAKGQGISLLLDSKNLSEHAFVADELEKKWSRWGRVLRNPLRVLELPTLDHLQTVFHVDLQQNVTDEELVEGLHPTSALGTFPPEVWQELKNLPEQADRGFFGSPILFPLAGSEESLAIVSLRQIQWTRDEIKLGAGGGVVKQSQEELEWNEILAKMNSVKKLLRL